MRANAALLRRTTFWIQPARLLPDHLYIQACRQVLSSASTGLKGSVFECGNKMTEVKLTDAQIKAAEAAFKAFDKRDEQKIKVGDIENALKKLGHSIKAEWLEKMEDSIDTEGTGYIEFEEFLTILQKKIQADEDERELREIFRVLDKEKKGEVNVNELRWILKNLGDDLTEEDIDDMIADVDTDGSGWVDYDEFAKLMGE